MNGWEKQYAQVLELRRRANEIEWYAFDAIKLRLADRTFYEPDFLVMTSTGLLEIHEVKGHWEDDAKVKIKVAADKFPFKFLAIRKDHGNWIEEEY